MQKRNKHLMLAGAAALSMPILANAATVTITFAPQDFLVATAATGPYTPASTTAGVTLGGTATNPILTVPTGDYIEYGLQALVTNTSNTGLGLASFQTGITDANSAISTVNPSPTIVNPFFSSVSSAGTSDGAGGVNPALGTAGSYISGGNSITSKASYGVGTPGELFNSQRIKPLTGGTNTFTVTQNLGALGFIQSLTTTGSGAPVYTNRPYSAAVDTVNALPVLTINYGATTGTGGSTTHSIISLTAGSTPVAGYGSADGTITMTGKGNGSYNVTPAVGFTTATTGSVLVSGFNPSTDTEIYALKLSSNGTPLTSAQINTVIGDINGQNGVANSSGPAVVASTISGVFANLFPASQGYDVLLTATGVAQPAQLGFDFSSAAETDTAVPGITVTGVAAVPEPATAAGLVLGAAGLLLGRRKNRLAIA